MKQFLFLLGLIISLTLRSNAQNEYYDAETIVDKKWAVFSELEKKSQIKVSKENAVDVLKILYVYLSQAEKNKLEQESDVAKKFKIYQDAFSQNAFLNIAGTVQDNPLTGLEEGGTNSAKNRISNLVSGIGDLDVTKFANGIADVMIERAKQELTIAFFNRFKKFAKANPEFQVLFPKTTDNLSNLLTFAYPQMLPKLRSGFLDDISQTTYSIEALLELPTYRTLFDNFPEVKVTIQSLKLIHQLENGSLNAAQIIKKFSEFDEWKIAGSVAFKNMRSTIQFAALFSESLRSKEQNEIWVSSKEISKLTADKIFAGLYLGFIYQEIKNQEIKYYLDPKDSSLTVNLVDLFGKQKDNILLMQNKISQFISLAETVNATFIDIKDKNTKGIKLSNEDYFNYIGVSIDAVDFSFGLVKVFDEKLQVEDYLAVARKSNNLYKDIYTKQYTQAVTDGLEMIAKLQELTKKSSNPVSDSKVQGALPHAEASNRLLDFVEGLKPYAIFMANMIEANDEVGVKAALENAILPVGSSGIKKYTRCNVSVQAYLGAYWRTSDVSKSPNSTWADRFGVTAPIGLSFTPGMLSWGKYGSLSLFVPLFDIGAIVDYKLVMDSTVDAITGQNQSVVVKDYSIQLGQIISPGIFAIYGFGANLPLSLGFGAQYGPGLSKIEANNNIVINNPSWRFNFFFAVDLPFFNVINKSKYKQY